MRISLISDQEWDQALQSSAYAEFFQTSFWKNQVASCIGGQGHLYLCEDDDHKWLVPCYTGAPWSKGFRIGSVGYGGPIPLQRRQDPLVENQKIHEMIAGLESVFKSRCTGVTTYPCKEWGGLDGLSITQVIPLKDSQELVFTGVVTGNVRTTIRRAEQTELTVAKIVDAEELKVAHRLLCETQIRVNALYTTPWAFFSGLTASNHVTVWGIRHEGEMIAMSLMLSYAKKAFHLFHGWKRDQIPPGTNQLLMWEMVKHAIAEECHSFNMGESHADSLRIAKQRWGAEEVPILKMSFQS